MYHEETGKSIIVVPHMIDFYMSPEDRKLLIEAVVEQLGDTDPEKEALILAPYYNSRRFTFDDKGFTESAQQTVKNLYAFSFYGNEFPEALEVSIGKDVDFYKTLSVVYTNYIKKPYYGYKIIIHYNGESEVAYDHKLDVTGHRNIYDFTPLIDKRAYCFFYLARRAGDSLKSVTIQGTQGYGNTITMITDHNPCPSCNCDENLPNNAHPEWAGYNCLPKLERLDHGMKESFVRNHVLGKLTNESTSEQLRNVENPGWRLINWVVNYNVHKESPLKETDIPFDAFIGKLPPEAEYIFKELDTQGLLLSFTIVGDIGVNATGMYYAVKYRDSWRLLEYSGGLALSLIPVVNQGIKVIKSPSKALKAWKASKAVKVAKRAAEFSSTRLVLPDKIKFLHKVPSKLKSIFSPTALIAMTNGNKVIEKLRSLKVHTDRNLLALFKKDKKDLKFMAAVDENPDRLERWVDLKFDEVLRKDIEVHKDLDKFLESNPDDYENLRVQLLVGETIFDDAESIRGLRNRFKLFLLLETVFRVPLDKLTVLPAETVFTLSKSEKLLSRIQGLSLSSQESQLLFKQLTDVNAQGFRQALVQNEKLVDAWVVLNNIGEPLAVNKIVSLDKTVRTAVSNLGNRPLESKILNVVMHSDGESFLINGIPMSHRVLVKYIKKTQPDFEIVRLLSCKAGAEIGVTEKRTLAQNLANSLNKKVDASPETVWIHGDGKITTGKNAAENTDNWNQYSPGNGKVKKTSVDKSKIKGAADDAVALEINHKSWLKSQGVPQEHLTRIDDFGDDAKNVHKTLYENIKNNKITADQLQNKEFVETWFEKQELDYLWGLKGEMRMTINKHKKYWNRMKSELGIDVSYQIVKINKATRGNRNCVYTSLATDYLLKGGRNQPIKFNPPNGTNTPSSLVEKWFARKFSDNEMSIQQIENEMKKLGDGATGLIACKFNNKTERGHVLNVVNIKGNIRVIDSQSLGKKLFQNFRGV